METKKVNPKALNLEKIADSTKKVTIGFRCKPNLKIALAGKASKERMTLSRYIESLLPFPPEETNSAIIKRGPGRPVGTMTEEHKAKMRAGRQRYAERAREKSALPPRAMTQEEERRSAEQMADLILSGYDKIHGAVRFFAKIDMDDLLEENNRGAIDLDIKLPMLTGNKKG